MIKDSPTEKEHSSAEELIQTSALLYQVSGESHKGEEKA